MATLGSDALTTLANVKEAVGVASTDTSKDTYLTNVINRATWLVESMCNRKFYEETQGGFKARRYNGGSSTHTTTGVSDEGYIYFDGSPTNMGGDTVINPDTGLGEFYLPAYPVRTNAETGSVTFQLAILSNRGSTVSGGETWDTTMYTEFDDYIVDRPRGVIRLLHNRFQIGTANSIGQHNYRVQMAAGYLYGSAQPYVPPDLEALCIEFAKQIFRESRNLQSESIGSWSRTFNLQIEDPVIQRTLLKYSRPSVL